MVIKVAKNQDIKEMAEISELVYPGGGYASFLKDQMQESQKNHKYKPSYLIMKQGKKIVGFIGYSKSRINYRIYEIFSLIIHPDYQKKGFGKKLLKETIKKIKALKKHKKDDSIILISTFKEKYFKKFGFKSISKIKDNNARVMSLHL